jgi:recombination protein RecA
VKTGTEQESMLPTNGSLATRQKNLDLALERVAKDFGEGAIMRLGDKSVAPVEVIPTGNILIDRALGVGGFPRGRIIEVFGPESSGKTTLTLTVTAQAQRRWRTRCVR